VPVRDDDLLFTELDRQLSEVRTACDGLATRSGLLVAAIAAVAAVLAPRINPAHHEILLVLTCVALGIAVLAGSATLMPWLQIGPVPVELQGWIGAPESTSEKLYLSKNIVLDANQDRLTRMRVLFSIQAIATIVAVGLALSYTAWRLGHDGE
jgi:hypothetical protein